MPNDAFVFLAHCEIDGGPTFSFGTDNIYWPPDNRAYRDKLLDIPSLTQTFGGIVLNSAITLQISDHDQEMMPWSNQLLGTKWVVQGVNHSRQEVIYSAWLECARMSWADGVFFLELEDAEPKAWEKLYPEFTYTADDHPELLEQDSGAAIPFVAGLGLKLRMVFIGSNNDAGPWRYGICEVPEATAYVLNIYRGSQEQAGAIVDPQEYTLSIESFGDYKLIIASFEREQRDFQGDLYYLSADVKYGADEQVNANIELERLLLWAGIGEFETPPSLTKQGETMSYGYGWDGQQKTIRATIEPILQILRASIIIVAPGKISLIKDEAKAINARYPVLEDTVAFSSIGRETPPAKVELEYWPSVYRPGELIHKQTREIPGGVGTETFQNQYIRNHVVADRLTDYLAKRYRYNFEVTMGIYRKIAYLGHRIEITGNPLIDSRSFTIAEVTMQELEIQARLIEYSDDLHTYTAGTLPGDPDEGYKPDYSGTMPDQPTSLRVVRYSWSGDTLIVTVAARPPSVNFAKLVFGIYRPETDQTEYKDGIEINANQWEASFTNVPGASTRTFLCYAENPFGVAGTAAQINWTAPADSNPPPTPTGVNAAWVLQDTNEFKAQVYWEKSTATDIEKYIIRRVGGTSTETTGTTVVHPDLINGGPGSETYYVRAIDFSGNTSGEAGVTKTRPLDSIPPAYPTNFSYTTTQLNEQAFIIDLSWSANTEPDLDHYEWREASGSANWTSTTATSARAGSYYPPNSTHSFDLVAVDTSGNRSTMASRTVFVPPDPNPPNFPRNLQVSFSMVDDNRFNATVSWSLSTSPDVQYYSVREQGGQWATVDENTSSYTFNALTPGGVERIFNIQAVDTQGNQSQNVGTSGTTPQDTVAPPRISNVFHQDLFSRTVATADLFKTLFQWTYPTAPTDLAGFRWQRVSPYVSSVGTFDKNLRSAISGEELNPLTTHSFDLWAYDEAGNNGAKYRYTFTTPGDSQGPLAPGFYCTYRWVLNGGNIEFGQVRVTFHVTAPYEPGDFQKYIVLVNNGDGNPNPTKFDVPNKGTFSYELPVNWPTKHLPSTGYKFFCFMAGVDTSGNEGPANSYDLTIP